MGYTLFIDLDGVLVDFKKGVLNATGKHISIISSKEMWPKLAKTPDFYNTLDWLPDGKKLWDYVKDKSPYILTGLPRGKWAEEQKRNWCKRELGPQVPVLTCFSHNKHIKAQEVLVQNTTPVLVDDRSRLKEKWESIGGAFIHHQNAEESIQRLRKLGV
ncbi:MAG: hypothetical protein ACLFR1_11740 [Spirochaetia bacterium]